MNVVITLVLCLSTSFAFGWLAQKLKASIVVGLILSGLVLGYPFFKNLIIEPNTNLILQLGNIGLVALMFLAGLEISWSMLYKERDKSIALAVCAFLTSLLLGFIVFYLMGFSVSTSLIVGICMSITAEATKAHVLIELNKLKTKVGSLMMGAGIVDDIFGILLFVLVSFLLVHSVATKEIIILVVAIASFFTGIIAHKFIGKETKHVKYFEKSLLLLVVPFFFISMGLHFSLQSLKLNPWILVSIVLIAFSGKILGSIISKSFTKLNLKQLYLVGWGMNSRGAVELAIALTAFNAGLLNTSLYSSLIVMALITTMSFPFFLRSLVKHNPRIMN